MLVSDFHYDLPAELIAQHPPAVRGSSRMLTLDRRTGAFADRNFGELPSLLELGDLLVLNDSRVLPARLYATRSGLTTQRNSPSPSGQIEVLLTERLAPAPESAVEAANDWLALVRPAKKVQPGETLLFHEAGQQAHAHRPVLTATVIAAGEHGERTLRFAPTREFHAAIDRIGHLPLPPYIRRAKEEPDSAEDRDRYQTVFSRERGSAAAPTAGLHFTPEVLAQLQERGVEVRYITLHVGLGTFQPVRAERTEEIRLHAEPYTLPAATAAALVRAREQDRRILAVGTTTTRTLEHIARESERAGQPIAAGLRPHSGSTSLFLSPGLEDNFKLVSGLVTNFHLPESTLLMLVSAFAGREHVLAAYSHAVATRYRFFSYGDCMLIT
jgi:S-adenosylmethionine:tRNA ribosyltransferase-isomerase